MPGTRHSLPQRPTPDNATATESLKAELEQLAAETGRSEADLIREGIALALSARMPPPPTIGIFVSEDPDFAERVDEYLVGFGER